MNFYLSDQLATHHAHYSSTQHWPHSHCCQRNNDEYSLEMETDGTFSIDTGLELVGVTEPVRRVESIYNLHEKGGPATCTERVVRRGV